MTDVRATVEKTVQRQGFENFGFTELKPLSLDYYRAWLNDGYQADMSYLERHEAVKRDPTALLPSAQSAIIVTKSYVPHPKPKAFSLPVAAYARGLDYHDWLLQELKDLVTQLREEFPAAEFLPFVDSMPVLERDFAVRAGLGWIGKNACLINEQRGSFEFIGGILTSLQIEASLAAAPDRCGTCTRCIDACPTNAILEGRKIDSNKCISYLTIESKAMEPTELTPKIDSYFGCDICQTVCPWNREVIATQPQYSKEELVSELQFILTASNRQIIKHFEGTALNRASPKQHRRNARVLATNLGLTHLLGHTPPVFQEASSKPLPPAFSVNP